MSILDYRKNFAFDDPLKPSDGRRVNLNEARGDYSRKRLLREFGLNVSTGVLGEPCSGKCVLFGGHRGCGKSTELLEIGAELKGDGRYFVVEIDALKALDINNLCYADIALTLAESLVNEAAAKAMVVPSVILRPLYDWYKQVSNISIKEETSSADLAAGAEFGMGLPLIGQLFAKLTTSIRSNTTHKTEIRNNVRNSFSALADAFNQLLVYVQQEAVNQALGKSVLFIVDGTDRLRGDEADDFFVRDIHQLRLLNANVIYCAPISILNEQGQAAQNVDAIFRLPMVKLSNKGEADMIEIARDRMREFVIKRLPIEYFANMDTLDLLVRHSGGHPRDLLRLVNLCFQEIDEGPISLAVAETATRRLSNEYRRLVQPDDLPLLVGIDRSGPELTPTTDQTKRLLFDLVLLEYNSFWWQSHPAVRSLEAYRVALDKHKLGAGTEH
ncbi:MAG: ATP-binding protein [Gammaproteobacteria bacterium]|nr:ATP-binding protein [Gammaproteobacteria bacterium]